MKIKYTGLYETINLKLADLQLDYNFKRNVWSDVSDEISTRILKNNYFISEDEFKNIPLAFEKYTNIAFFRYGALGDLIQLLPIARYFKKKYPHLKLTLVSTESFAWPLRRETDAFDVVIPIAKFVKTEFERTFYLDGILENDHNPENSECNRHRVKIYMDFFGIDLQDYDFTIHYTEAEMRKVEKLLNDVDK